ncbi:hypothetical protein [Bacillus sp. CECT 9360]|uniref:hypothetical protein n=1 Tax=Bacillus sp. CECT 9360 TaxID=2845821 RepID=UPI001E2A6033|nr:hypothetical protein [Bacillus sp. CECT 9360]
MKEDETTALSKKVASEFLLLEEGKEFIPKSTEVLPSVGGVDSLIVYGYYKGNKEEEIFVTVETNNDYEVSTYGIVGTE